jgi:hypothetical protein
MNGYIKDIDWVNANSMLYWSYPSSYKKNSKEEIRNYIFSGDYYGALKVDGYYQRLVKDEDGNCFMIARNKNVKGEAVNKYEWVPQLHSYMESLPNGSVLLCETYLPGNEGSKKITSLLGCLKDKCIARQEKNQKLHFYIFDVCAWDGENMVDTPALDRFNKLKTISEEFINPYVEYAEYFNGSELWDKIGEYLESGREGVVITHKDCPIYFKRTPARMSIKIKKEINKTIDCIFTGHYTPPSRLYEGKSIETWRYWEDVKTGEKKEGDYYADYAKGAAIEPVTKPYFHNWAGSLEIGLVKGDKVVPIGFLSGLTEEIKANPEQYKGRVIEVTAMEIMEDTHALRHGKFVQFRDDLTIQDATWEKCFGNE